MRLPPRFLTTAIALAMALPAAASAQTTGVTFLGGHQATLGGLVIGPQTMAVTGLTSTFDVFCIDRDNGINFNSVFDARFLTFTEAVSTTSSYMGTTNFAALQRALGGSGYSSLTANTITPLANPNTDYFKRLQASASMADQFGASPTPSWDELQVAIWALFSASVGDTPDAVPVPAGDLFAAALASASSAVDAWSNYGIILDANAWNAAFDVPLRQTFITRIPTTVPEPGTWVLMATGLLALSAASRRRRANGSAV